MAYCIVVLCTCNLQYKGKLSRSIKAKEESLFGVAKRTMIFLYPSGMAYSVVLLSVFSTMFFIPWKLTEAEFCIQVIKFTISVDFSSQ